MSPRSSAAAGADALAALGDEMSATVASGSESAPLSDLLMDPGAAICDGEGRVLACTSIRHLGAFSAVAAAHAAGWSFALAPRSVVLLNDPFGGGTRVLDFYAVHPVALNGTGEGWLAITRSTGADLGGNCFGGYNPSATEVWAEGARITPLRVYEGGSWGRETLACVTLNSRTPNLLAAQLRAMIEAVVTAGPRLPELVGELGDEPAAVAAASLEACAAGAGESLSRGTAATASVPVAMPPRSDAGAERGRVNVAVQRRNGALVVDLSASTAAAPGYINATRQTTVSAALAALFAEEELRPVASAALLSAVDLITQPGTIVDAVYPAPTACGELTVAAAVRSAVSAAVGGGEEDEGDGERGILGPDGRLAETLAESLKADEARVAARVNGGRPWR